MQVLWTLPWTFLILRHKMLLTKQFALFLRGELLKIKRFTLCPLSHSFMHALIHFPFFFIDLFSSLMLQETTHMYLICDILFIITKANIWYPYTLYKWHFVLFIFAYLFEVFPQYYAPHSHTCYYSNAGLLPASTLCLVFTHIWSLRITPSSLPNTAPSHLSANGPKSSISPHASFLSSLSLHSNVPLL